MPNFKRVTLALALVLAFSGCFHKKAAAPEAGETEQGEEININTIQNPEGDNANIDVAKDAGQAAPGERPAVVLKTSMGDITLELFTSDAPRTVTNFLSLVKSDFYDGIT